MSKRVTPLPGGVLPIREALAPPCASVGGIVVVPVRDEAAHLPAALAALAAQVDDDGAALAPDAFEILVLANNCSDDSAALARAFAASHPRLRIQVVEADVPPPRAHIGYVRGQLMDEACRRLEATGRADGFIASTDGDSRVAVDWLVATRRELACGADAVGGRIVTDARPATSAAALRLQRLDAAHSLLRSRLASLLDPDPADPWPRHHQHFGASLAVTARAYRQVGGVPAVEWLEDEALVQQLLRADLRVRHSPRVRVTTSARHDGRAEVGLAWQLRQWAGADWGRDGPLVEAPARYARALGARPLLRALWRRGAGAQRGRGAGSEIDAVAKALELSPLRIAEALGAVRPFGALWDELDRERAGPAGELIARVSMAQAMRALRTLVQLAARSSPWPEATAMNTSSR